LGTAMRQERTHQIANALAKSSKPVVYAIVLDHEAQLLHSHRPICELKV
jgi:hypothetical protein